MNFRGKATRWTGVAGLCLMAQLAHAGQSVLTLEIDKQPVGDALNEFARQSGFQVIIDSREAQGINGSRVAGSYSPTEALQHLLAGTGLTFEWFNERTVIVRRAPSHSTAPQFTRIAETTLVQNDVKTPAPTPSSQTPAAQKLEEVTVTARRREESLQEVPIAITAITAEDLERKHIETASDLRTHVPSLTTNVVGGSRHNFAWGIRGQRTDGSLMVQDPSITTYFADAVQAHSFGFGQSLYDIESVQVLKGPQGTLFGRNTTGGAVVVSPRKPGKDFEVIADLGIGNFNRHEAGLVVNAPMGERAAVRFVGKVLESDGFSKNVLTGKELDSVDSKMLRGSLRWNPTDAIESTTIADWIDLEGGGIAAMIDVVNPTGAAARAFPGAQAAVDRQRARSGSDRWDVESEWGTGTANDFFGRPSGTEGYNWGVTNNTSFTLGGGLTLRNIASYRKTREDTDVDLDGSPFPINGFNTNQRIEQWTEELQLLGSAFDDRLSWIVGGFYLREKGREFATTVNRAFQTQNTTSGGGINKSYAGFAQGTFKMTPTLSLTAGARYNKDKREAYADGLNLAPGGNPEDAAPVSCRIFNAEVGGGPLPLDQCRLEDDATFSEPTWTVSLEWQAWDDVLLYLTQRRGYRAGGFNMRSVRPGRSFGPFEPEIVDDYEAGVKADWQIGGASLRTNLAVFRDKYDDLQRQVIVATPSAGGGLVTVTTISNAASSTVDGAEFEATLVPLEGLEISGFYSYLDASYDDYSTLAPSGAPIDLSGRKFPGIPENQVSATIRYEFPWWRSLGQFAASGNYYRQSKTVLNDAEPQFAFQDAYSLLNFRTEWQGIAGRPLDAALYVNNANNEFYYVGAVSLYTGIGFTAFWPGQPRTYGLELKYRFGD